MNSTDRPPFLPPFRPVVVADPAEVIALRVLVMALLAIHANAVEEAGVGSAQAEINRLGTLCQQSLLSAPFESEAIRSRAIDHINSVLGGIGFPPNEDQMN